MFLTHNFSSKNVCVTVFIHEIKKGYNQYKNKELMVGDYEKSIVNVLHIVNKLTL